ncbi:MAG: hypothetical protein GY817_00600, partial [bacterium]|nr:hypothetical protein [bacterium]
DKIQILKERFYATDLGKIYRAIPFKEIIKKLKLKHNQKGTEALFTPKGKIALEILKAYTSSI